MNLNTDKCHLLTSIHKYEHRWTQIGKDMVWEENEVKLLRVTIDTELKFETYISNICSKANKNLVCHVDLKILLTFQQRRVLFKSFFEVQFNPFVPNAPFIYPLKTSQNLTVF